MSASVANIAHDVRRATPLSPSDSARRRRAEAGVVTEMVRSLLGEARRATAEPRPGATGAQLVAACMTFLGERRRVGRITTGRGRHTVSRARLSSGALSAPRA